MSLQKIETLMEVGCDYISATTRDASSHALLGSFGQYLLSDAVKRGSKRRSTRTLGYSTAHAEGVSIGRRHDGWLLRASGATAREHWFQIQDLADNITRFDIQVTIETCDGAHDRLRRLWAGAKRKRKGEGREAKRKCVVAPTGFETIYSGSRTSDCLIRCYDKFAQSGLPHYRGCVRYEVQLNHERARDYASQLATKEDEARQIACDVFSIVRARFTRLPADARLFDAACAEIKCLRSPELAETVIRSIKFMTDCVSPTVTRLVNAGYITEVLEALKLSEHVIAKPRLPSVVHSGDTVH